MPALLLGSISTLADTSELQRDAFNRAFAEHGLDWEWGQDEYRSLLTGNGGADRVAAYAEQRGEQVDSDAVHQTKSTLFQQALAAGVEARPGVAETIAAARREGWRVGLVTTTSASNVDALLSGLSGISREDFDVVTDVSSVQDPKPSPAVYAEALQQLGEEADHSVAVEDNVGGVRSATEAGVSCLAFPNENTAAHDFGEADVVEALTFEDVRAAAGEGR
jgi:HAD superfamily hydrolase (TIGR01509 family)